MLPWLLLVAGLVVLVMIGMRLGRRRPPRALHPESDYRVTFDSNEIAVTDPKGDTRSIHWDELGRVSIATTDEGPWLPDVFWAFHATGASEPSVVFPGGATGEAELLSELQRRLTGFDNRAVSAAMASTSNAIFTLWTKGPAS